MQTTTLMLLVAMSMGGPQTRGEVPHSPATVVQHCQVFLIDDVEVPAQESGMLVHISVADGDRVRFDDRLAQIDDRQAQLRKEAAGLERDAAQAQADNDIEVRYAIKSFELAEAELNQDLEINRKSPGAVSAAEVRRKRLAKIRSELQIDRSQLDLRVAQMTADVQNAAVLNADETIRRCQIRAPFDGIVAEVFRDQNEWVNAGEPVLRVIRMAGVTGSPARPRSRS